MAKHPSLSDVLEPLPPLRRLRRRRRRLALLAACAAGLAALAASRVATPLVVYNASASAPLGFYGVTRATDIIRGDLVLAAPPAPARLLAAERGYLPPTVLMVKRIAALADDLVCAEFGIVVIDKRVVAEQLAIDRAGRPLPAWNGCRVLGTDEVFLLMEDVRNSFDSRYFGPVSRTTIIGRLVPLWTR